MEWRRAVEWFEYHRIAFTDIVSVAIQILDVRDFNIFPSYGKFSLRFRLLSLDTYLGIF